MDSDTLSVMVSRCVVLLISILASGASFAATVLVYGDSLSAGYGLARDDAWPALLERRLKELKPDYRVANASISGETSLGGRNRIDSVLKSSRPEIVIVALGANDGLRGQSIDTMRGNLEAIIDACRKTGARVMLVGMRLPPNYGSEYTEKFRQAYADLAKSKRVPWVPFMLEGFAEDPRWFLGDGIHPTRDAQPRILDTVWRVLKPLLRP